MCDSPRIIRATLALGSLLVLQAALPVVPRAYAQECEAARCDAAGRTLVAAEDYSGALVHFVRGCESGEAAACSSMESLLTAQPVVRTAGFERGLRRGCAAQNDGLCAQLGRDYVDDIGRTRRGPGVDRALSAACERNVAAACTARGVRTLARQRRHPERARADFESACRLRDGRGCRHLGELVESASPSEATSHFTAGCRHGDLPSCGHQGRLIAQDDPAGAAALLGRACAANDGDSCVALGRLHAAGGWPGASAEAGELAFATACQRLENPEACGRLGQRLHARGEDTAAEPLLQTSCRARYGAACVGLAEVFAARGNAGQARAQYRRARRALIRSCRAGVASDCASVSSLYGQGHGVRASAPQASRWYQRACEGGAGDATRCCELGHASSCQVAQLSAANVAAAATLQQMEAAVVRETEARQLAEAASARESQARQRAEEGAAVEAFARHAAETAAADGRRQAAERLAAATSAQEQARAALARETTARAEAEASLAQETQARRLAETAAQTARAQVDNPANVPAPTGPVTAASSAVVVAPQTPAPPPADSGAIDWSVTSASGETNVTTAPVVSPSGAVPVVSAAAVPPVATPTPVSTVPTTTPPEDAQAAQARWAAAAAAREAEARRVAEAQRLSDAQSARETARQATARDAAAEAAARAAVQAAQRAAAEAASEDAAARRAAAAAAVTRRTAAAAAAAEATRRRQATARAATRRRQIELAAAQQTQARERAAAAEAAARLRAQEAAAREATARQQAREAAAREAVAREQIEQRQAAERREAQQVAAREARARRLAEQAAAQEVLARERAEAQARVQAAARARAQERETAERARLAALAATAAEEQRLADLRQQELTRAAEEAQARQEEAAAAAVARRAAQQAATAQRAAAQRTLVQQREEQRLAARARAVAERQRVAAARVAERERRAEAARRAEAGPPPAGEFIRMCDAGDRDACQRAGLLVRDGEGVDADPAQALVYLERACNESHTTSCTAAIELLAASDSPHPAQLARLHEPLCVSENNTAACERALTVMDDAPGSDMALYLRLAGHACEAGQTRSCVRLGDARVHGGEAGLEDRSAAAAIYARMCSEDSPLGCPGVGEMCRTGLLASCEHLLGACAAEVQGACGQLPSAAARAPSGPLNMTQSPQALATRALTDMSETHFLEAETYLLAALGHTDDPWVSEHRGGLELALRFAGQRLGWLIAPCTRAGTEVFRVGNEQNPTACGVPMRVPVGENEVELRAAGHQSIRHTALVSADETNELDVLLPTYECESPTMTHIAGVEGGCCWDDQSWEDGECVGVPSCSLDMQVDGDECVLFDPDAQKPSRFRLSLFGGVTNFLQTDTGLFRDGLSEDSRAFQLGPRFEVRAGVRLASVLTVEATFGATIRSVDAWLDCAPGMSCATGSPSTYSLDAGLMLQLHTSPRRELGNFAFHVGVGVRPWARITFDGQGEAGSLTAVVLPGELGASLFLGSAVSLSLVGQAEMWLPHSYCGNGADGGRYCLDGGDLTTEFAWSAQVGINFHL